jgi:formylglycine-generating enzyme required for sulfatase activity
MMKTSGMAMLVLGMSLAVAGGDSTGEESTAQTQPARPRGDAGAKELTLDLGGKVTMKLVQIPAGKFVMGSLMTEKDRDQGEVQHEVTISKPFYLGVYEVTVDQYAQFVKDTGQKHQGPPFKQTGDHPVVNVVWNDARAFCKWLSKRAGKTVVLPTEAQWKYACRAGTKTRFSFGDKDRDLRKYANCFDKSNIDDQTAPVGPLKPNAWGMYDMHGNAMEWCSDWYADDYPSADQTDPTGPANGSVHVLRGGCSMNKPRDCRSANRFRGTNSGLFRQHHGFRVAVVSVGVD